MKKEMLLTIVLGLLIGLLITFGMYRAKSSQSTNDTLDTTPSPASSANVAENEVGNLVLHTPDDEQIVDSPTITIAGTTKPNIFVVILLNNIESITTADSSGNFSVQKELSTGSNIIVVQAISEDGTVTKVERTIIYSTVDFELAIPSASASATVSAQPSSSVKPIVN